MHDTKSFQPSTRIHFRCPGCKVLLSVSETHKGKAFCCPKCEAISKVEKDGSSALIPRVEEEFPEKTKPAPKPKLKRRRVSEMPRRQNRSTNPLWFIVAGCGFAIAVLLMILFLGGPSQSEIDLKNSARTLAERITQDPLAPLDFTYQGASIREMLDREPAHLLTSPISSMRFHEAQVYGDTGTTIMAVATASNSTESRLDLDWALSDDGWILKSAAYGGARVDVNHRYEEIGLAAKQHRRKEAERQNLAMAFATKKDGLIEIIRNAERTKLRKLASEVTDRTVVNQVVDFYADLVNLEVRTAPSTQNDHGITWSLPFTARYHRGGRKVAVTGTLNTFWRLEGESLALVDFSSKVESSEDNGAGPAIDSERILRYSFDALFTDIPAKLVFEHLQSNRVRFDISADVNLETIVTLHLKQTTLKEILDKLSDMLDIRYGFTSEGKILITKR